MNLKCVAFIILLILIPHHCRVMESVKIHVDDDFLPKYIPRPTIYAGVQTMSKYPLYFGLMYHEYDNQRSYFIQLREVAQYSDKVNFHVQRADGIGFAKSIITDSQDSDIVIESSYTIPKKLSQSKFDVEDRSYQDAFMYQVKGVTNDKGFGNSRISVFLYIGISDPSKKNLTIAQDTERQGEYVIYGNCEEVGKFRLRTISLEEEISEPKTSQKYGTYFYGNETDRPFVASEMVLPILKSGVSDLNSPACCNPLNHEQLLPDQVFSKSSNLMVLQKVLKTPFTWTVVFENIDNPVEKEDLNFEKTFAMYNQNFEKEFDEKFPVTNFLKHGIGKYSKIPQVEWIEFGRIMLSSLLYGLSYFEGSSLVKDPHSGAIWERDHQKLLTLIPAKVGFPRGFYWDEAFHQMVTLRWNTKLFEIITRDWYNLQNETTGWIAREQIIGDEPKSRAPEWAWPGVITQMNPPVYFMTKQQYLHINRSSAIALLSSIYEKIDKTYHWYMNNLRSDIPFTYVWNGRVGDSSLDSGLDDFPRPSIFMKGEKSVDLQSWMVRLSYAMAEISKELGFTEKYHEYDDNAQKILNNLQMLFWNESVGYYVDIGSNGSSTFHSDHIGFPGMLPLCLGFEKNKTRIQAILNRLLDRDQLYDEEAGGILSLNKKDSKFRFTGNYWRGNLWVNQQYICCEGLKVYEKDFEDAKKLRLMMQNHLLTTMYKNYYERDKHQRGLYETYHPFTGKGYNNVPFTGWTTLALLMMSEDYI